MQCLLSITVEALTDMSVAVLGPVYADDSEETTPSPLQVAAMFTSTQLQASPLSIPVTLTATASKR